MTQTKILLDASEIPTHWCNVVADMPNPPAPPLGMAAYDKYFAGELTDFDYPEEAIEQAPHHLPKVG